jgi:hypothetical protein
MRYDEFQSYLRQAEEAIRRAQDGRRLANGKRATSPMLWTK